MRLNILISEISKMYNFLGLYFRISKHNSEPIDPPPPVTNMFLL